MDDYKHLCAFPCPIWRDAKQVENCQLMLHEPVKPYQQKELLSHANTSNWMLSYKVLWTSFYSILAHNKISVVYSCSQNSSSPRPQPMQACWFWVRTYYTATIYISPKWILDFWFSICQTLLRNTIVRPRNLWIEQEHITCMSSQGSRHTTKVAVLTFILRKLPHSWCSYPTPTYYCCVMMPISYTFICRWYTTETTHNTGNQTQFQLLH